MKRRFASLLIFLCAVVAYLPALRNGFVWDDTALILRDPLIRSWRLIPEGFNHFLFVDATASDFYRPIQRLTYTLEYTFFAFNPLPYHLDSVLLHAGAGIALFFLCEELLALCGFTSPGRRWAALAGALVWAIHPVQSAAVVYVSGRADTLAALFGFLGCYFLLRSATPRSKNSSILLHFFAGILLLSAALSKESGLVFCAIALLLAAWTAGRKGIITSAGVVAVVVAAYLSLRSPAEHNPVPNLSTPPAAVTKPITMARAVAEYTGLILFPLNLHMERDVNARPQPETPDAAITPFAWRELQTLLGLVLFAGFAAWVWHAWRRSTAVFRLLILSAISYLPVSGIVSLNAAVAEHWLYVPAAFLFGAAALEFQSFLFRASGSRLLRSGAIISLAAWIVFLGVRTAFRTLDWKDQRTFVERTIADGGDSARMWINLGGLELSEGKLDRAKSALNKALALEPDQPFAVMNLAVVALRQKDFSKARELGQRAVKMPAVEAQAHEFFAVLEFQEKGVANPLRLRLASRTGSPNWEIEKRYVRLLDESGATDSAIYELEASLKNEWYRAESWDLLGSLLRKRGKTSEAEMAESLACAYDVHLDQHKLRL